MQVRVVEYSEDRSDALAAFNARLAVAGPGVRFPPPPDSPWATTLAPGLLNQRYVALDEDGQVRGAYALRLQEFWLNGRLMTVPCFLRPVSEAVVNPDFAHVALAMLVHVTRLHPLLYGLGMGGLGEPVARLLHAAGWKMSPVPFYYRIVRPAAFLKNITYLRRTTIRRAALDLLAGSGLGSLLVGAWNTLHARQGAVSASVHVDVEDDFGPWADDLWNAVRQHYRFCAVRDRATLHAAYPPQASGFVRLKVRVGNRLVGWSLLLNSELKGHSHFGDMRLGSIVDCLAEPNHSAEVIEQSRRFLVRQGTDLIISNQSHRIWREAFRRCGFATGPSNFIFASSRALTKALAENSIFEEDIHVNRSDGDGPINL